MTGFLKCHGMTEDGAPCPKRRICYRFKTPADEFGQTYIRTTWSYDHGCKDMVRTRPPATGLTEDELRLGYGMPD